MWLGPEPVLAVPNPAISDCALSYPQPLLPKIPCCPTSLLSCSTSGNSCCLAMTTFILCRSRAWVRPVLPDAYLISPRAVGRLPLMKGCSP